MTSPSNSMVSSLVLMASSSRRLRCRRVVPRATGRAARWCRNGDDRLVVAGRPRPRPRRAARSGPWPGLRARRLSGTARRRTPTPPACRRQRSAPGARSPPPASRRPRRRARREGPRRAGILRARTSPGVPWSRPSDPRQRVSGQVSPPPRVPSRGSLLSSSTFAGLGVSDAVSASLARARHHRAVPDPGARHFRRPRRARHSRPVADRVGQDARLRHPAGGAAERRRPAALGADPGADARAGRPGGAPSSAIARARGLRVAAAYGGASIGEQAKKVTGAQVSSPRPAASTICRRGAIAARASPHPRAGRGRPDARHGLSAAGRQDCEAAAPGPPDDVLLGHAGR